MIHAGRGVEFLWRRAPCAWLRIGHDAAANGNRKRVVFLTLEDETGNVNVIVWPSLLEEQRREVMGARLLGVYGQWQYASNVRHLVAKRLVDLTHLLGDLDTRSRNFH